MILFETIGELGLNSSMMKNTFSTKFSPAGLWFEKRLPKVAEPSRTKAHWDYLLEEMTWIATDFAQERKWKKAMARKVSGPRVTSKITEIF